ncbi:MAG: alpha/beta fold hydrolase [Phycisphaeraceae bacterium]
MMLDSVLQIVDAQPRRSAIQRSGDWLATRLAWSVLRWPRWSWVHRFNPRCPKVGDLLGLHGRCFTVMADDAARLDGLFVPARREARPRLPVVLAHGIVEVKELHARRARELSQRGHDVILFDTRAHGRSTGRHITFGVRERHDVKAVVDHAQRQGWIGDRVIAMGMSLGAGTMLQYAAIDPRVVGVVAIAPFADMASAVASYHRLIAPFLPWSWVCRGFDNACRQAGFAMAEASALEAMAKIKAPLLVVAAGRDVNLPPAQHAYRLAQAAGCDYCRVLTIDGATHFTLFRHRQPEMDRAVLAFCARISDI